MRVCMYRVYLSNKLPISYIDFGRFVCLHPGEEPERVRKVGFTIDPLRRIDRLENIRTPVRHSSNDEDNFIMRNRTSAIRVVITFLKVSRKKRSAPAGVSRPSLPTIYRRSHSKVIIK